VGGKSLGVLSKIGSKGSFFSKIGSREEFFQKIEEFSKGMIILHNVIFYTPGPSSAVNKARYICTPETDLFFLLHE